MARVRPPLPGLTDAPDMLEARRTGYEPTGELRTELRLGRRRVGVTGSGIREIATKLHMGQNAIAMLPVGPHQLAQWTADTGSAATWLADEGERDR